MKKAAALGGSVRAKVRVRIHRRHIRDAEGCRRWGSQSQACRALAAHFEYLCALKGSERPAYVPVVASGSNALVIHYTANNQLLKSGDLVLVDAGCELKFV
jgi:Xaa-Pro aminopeptidase